MSNPPEMTPPSPPPPAPPAAGASADHTVAILSYITPIGFIIAIVMHTSKKTPLGSFHLRQGLGLLVTSIAVWFPFMILSLIPLVNLLMFFVVWPLLALSFFVLWIMGLMAAVNGQMKPMPVVGEYYQKWFAGAFV